MIQRACTTTSGQGHEADRGVQGEGEMQLGQVPAMEGAAVRP